MPREDCLFCNIVAGKRRSWVIYRDKQIMAILDLYPYTRGHSLIIPIRHFESVFDTPEHLLKRIVTVAKELSISYERTLGIQGVCINVLNHKKKSPAFRHFHMAVIPRYDKRNKRDPANVKPNQRFPKESDRSLDGTLTKIKSDRMLLGNS